MPDPAAKPKLFLYSLLLPVSWISLGTVMEIVAPGVRLGVPGLVAILFTVTGLISLLFARKHRRRFSTRERWRLTIYCFAWAFLSESLALLYVVSFPEETGIAVNTDAVVFSEAVTAILDFVLVWAVMKYWSPRFIDWYIQRSASSA